MTGTNTGLGRSSWRRRLTVAAAIALGLTGVGSTGTFAATLQGGTTAVRVGVAPTAPHGATRTASPAGDTTLHLDIELAPRDPAGLNAFVAAVSTPGSAGYHHYLAKGQFGPMFGASPSTVAAVSRQLSAAGLVAGPLSSDGLTLPVTATIAQAKYAFGIDFAGYALADGHAAYANTSAPLVPSGVTGVVGLNDLVHLTPAHTPLTHTTLAVPASTRAQAVRPASATPAVCARIQDQLAQKNQLFDTQNYWEPGTLSAASVYDTGGLNTRYGNTGSGVTVGLFELESFSPADVVSYQNCMGTNVPVTAITVDGGPTAPPGTVFTTGVGAESALDIETVAGLAPGVSINVYQGPDAANATEQQVLDTYQRMVSDDTAQVLSTSWGICELELNAADPAAMGAEASVFAQAAAQGQTWLAASGDSGSTTCFANPASAFKADLAVSDPAGQPFVTAVGGTTMTGTAPNVQSTWNTPAAGGIQGAASGGGVSAFASMSGTANYQSGVQGAGYTNACNAAAGATCRQVPDVSAVADPNTAYLVAYGQEAGNSQDWLTIGGTSGAAPLWAAIAALADAGTGCAANGPVGLMNPSLYQSQSQAALTDITTGNNVVPDSGYPGGLYVAGQGYDLATGLGTPKASRLVESLCGGVPAGAGSTYTPVTPVRLLDTRVPIGVPTATPLGPNQHLSVQVTGNGVPTTGVTAAVLNITATNGTAGSFWTAYPDGTATPLASNVNFVAGQTIPNLVTVPVGANGRIDIFNRFGSVDVIADLSGYYTTGGGSLLQPVTPVRLLDTRVPIGVPTATPLGPNQHLSVQVTGNGVPTTGVTAAVLNITATNGTAGSFLTAYPDGTATPLASNVNFVAGQTIPNLVTVPVGANGRIDIFNRFGSVDVIADLSGFYTTSGSGFKFHASPPHRLVDTRSGTGVASGQVTPVGPGGTFGLPLTDVNGTGNMGPFGGAAALVLNVTVTGPTANSFVTVYPSGVARPPSSNLNFTAGETIPNAVVTPVNGDSIDFFNLTGNLALVVDVSGYFASN
ncbi:MAG TPA: S53 family peptidase, partial [Pseudonocardiaceae bacterium]